MKHLKTLLVSIFLCMPFGATYSSVKDLEDGYVYITCLADYISAIVILEPKKEFHIVPIHDDDELLIKCNEEEK